MSAFLTPKHEPYYPYGANEPTLAIATFSYDQMGEVIPDRAGRMGWMYNRHGYELLAQARRGGARSEEEGRDVVQDTACALWQREDFEPARDFPLSLVVAQSRGADRGRQRGRRRDPLAGALPLEDVPDPHAAADADDPEESARRDRALWQAIRSLPECERVVVEMRVRCSCAAWERGGFALLTRLVSDYRGCPVSESTVRNQWASALKKLKAKLASLGYGKSTEGRTGERT